MLEAILEVVTRTLGDNHVAMAMARSNLARASVLCERWDEAETLLIILVKSRQSDHPDLGQHPLGLRACANPNWHIIAPGRPRALKIHEQMIEIYHLPNRAAESQALSLKVPATKVPLARELFDMLLIQGILRRENELDRLTNMNV
ncbi:uncharacterized protein A1O5_11906 [Cladophialophora psammophila CBS 110553]|uniref:Uncharacterized protein n=1 Tax=Cladophialophora psammophila CBS 110553 TaxID=1182543 RepID=W9W099_9EURO|nr:uncharacterized protein A1O5_11906 [Cladophialophora psammophila CBS 110553]EXJ61348.1 hypothetical protein A1O5_11906 [Cladophialophora psammophila CBS 110553]